MTDVSVVIPTAKTTVKTTDSLPDVDTHIIGDEYTLNEARNEGVRRATTDTIVVMDDDLAFPEPVFWRVVAAVDDDTLVGVADWDYGWIAGRVMAFRKSLWEAVGGFDERLGSHMGDTKFALDAQRHGYSLKRVPRDVFYHEPHDRDITAWDHAWRGVYLAFRHPRHAPRLFRGLTGLR